MTTTENTNTLHEATGEFLTVGELLEAIGRQTGLHAQILDPALAEVMLYIGSSADVAAGVRSVAAAVAATPVDDAGYVCLELGPCDGYTMVPVPVEFESVVVAMVDASYRQHAWLFEWRSGRAEA